MDEGLIESNVAFHVSSPAIAVPPVKFNFKKDFSEVENRIDLLLVTDKNVTKEVSRPKTNFTYVSICVSFQFIVEVAWKYDSIKKFRANLNVETPLKGFEKTAASTQVHMSKNDSLVRLNVLLHPLEVDANASIKGSNLNAAVIFDFGKHRYASRKSSKLFYFGFFQKSHFLKRKIIK